MANPGPNVGGNITVHNAGTSTFTVGTMHVDGQISINQVPGHPQLPGHYQGQIEGAGQGAANNALPILPNAGHAGGIITPEDIEMLCDALGQDYVALAVRLQFSQPDMDMFLADYERVGGHKNVIRRMLNKWKSKLPDTATRQLLAEKLKLIDRNDIAKTLLQN